jgi:hypothetical protein
MELREIGAKWRPEEAQKAQPNWSILDSHWPCRSRIEYFSRGDGNTLINAFIRCGFDQTLAETLDKYTADLANKASMVGDGILKHEHKMPDRTFRQLRVGKILINAL